VSGARALFEGALRPAVLRADAELRRLVNVQATQARELADRIEEVRNRSRRVGLVLDLLCVGLAALAATLAVTVVRRNAALLEEHGRMQEERARELDQFASRVAHDVLSPLSTVTLALGQTKRHVHEEAVVRNLSRAEASVRRVRTIVDGLLAFARAGARPEAGASTDAREVVTGIVEELRPDAAAERIEIVAEPLVPARVACTAGVLSSVIANLLRNAIKYMGDAATRRITVRSLERDGVVCFEVEDTGPGLPREMHEAIFESYVRIAGTSRSGLGLGLATVKRLVLAHGGKFGVRSRPGEGATFWFDLPRARGAAAENVRQQALGSAE
jgi:signal transduction histidine kinase